MKKFFYASAIFLIISHFFISCASTDIRIPGETAKISKNIASEYFNIAEGYMGIKNYSKAAEYYKLAIRDKNTKLKAYYKLGRSYALAKNWKEAETIYKNLLSRDPDNIDLKLSIAYITAMKGDNEKAIDMFAKLKNDNPENQEIAENYITLLIAYRESIKSDIKTEKENNKEIFELKEKIKKAEAEKEAAEKAKEDSEKDSENANSEDKIDSEKDDATKDSQTKENEKTTATSSSSNTSKQNSSDSEKKEDEKNKKTKLTKKDKKTIDAIEEKYENANKDEETLYKDFIAFKNAFPDSSKISEFESKLDALNPDWKTAIPDENESESNENESNSDEPSMADKKI